MLSVQKAEYAGDYKIHLIFNNGMEGTADLQITVLSDSRPIFSKLKDQRDFQDFRIQHNTVIWSKELDLAPEYLFYLAFQNDSEFQEQFRQWGYIVYQDRGRPYESKSATL